MLSVNPATAYALLNDYVSLAPGDWVGLGLASSAVGRHVTAVAKRAGIKVLAIVRSAEAAAKVDADAVLIDGDDLTERILAALGAERLRAFFDGGSPDLAKLVPAIADGGTVIAYSAVTGQPPVVPLGDLIYRGISLRSFFILRWLATTPRERLVSIYNELAGTLHTSVAATYSLESYREALAHAGREGKVLFTPDH
jgi:NADPH:quinone reductase-like Zn-dependent oxidoreductase